MIEITDKVNCTGCHACFSICPQKCIAMEPDDEGFLYPIVEKNSCIDCGLCEKVCPLLNRVATNKNSKAVACKNRDRETRVLSSSGGVFTLIAEEILRLDGIVFGAAFDSELSVAHKLIDSCALLSDLRGSKYVQSRIDGAYLQAKNALDRGITVLFSGTPCQIGGIKAYLGKEYSNLILVDLICHGVPSPLILQRYIDYHEERSRKRVERVFFRNKSKGWKRFSMQLCFEDGTAYQETIDKDLYLRAFLSDACLRPSCYECIFKSLERHGDITLADFWGVDNVLPDMDDDLGTSLILLNSEKGNDLFEKVARKLEWKETEINKAIGYNLAAIESAPLNRNRRKFFSKLHKFSFEELVDRYCKRRISIVLRLKVRIISNKHLRKVVDRFKGRH